MTDTARFGPVIADLLDRTRPMPLGPASPDAELAEAMQAVTIDRAFADRAIADRSMAEACLAGLWLRVNDLDASHRLSQGIDSPTGSYWHAIMHRREPDYANASYWFRRVGDHPVYGPLNERAAALTRAAGQPGAAAFMADQFDWDPVAFNETVRDVIDADDEATALAIDVQEAEWWLLFEHCFDGAVGGG